MIDKTLEEVRRNTGLSITAAQVEQILKNQPCSMDEKVKSIILAQGKDYVNRIFRTLTESGFDVAAVPIIFAGGGALLIKQNLSNNRVCAMSIVEDIKANAIGYEKIVRAIGASQ
jgi:plasmid segregation protein ParM